MEVTSFPAYRINLDFKIIPEIAVLRDRIARFVDQEVLPVEADRSAWDQHENIGYGALQILRRKARQEGLWCLQLSLEAGGLGLSKVGMAVCCEAMNRSIFGPVVFNSAAPDDGNMMVLEKLGTAEQKSRWLARIELFAETSQSQTIIGEAEVFLE